MFVELYGVKTFCSINKVFSHFQSITGCDAERAQFYLESSNWQLDLAMASFYEGDADQGMDLGAPPASGPAPPAAPGGQPPAQGRINIPEDSDSEDEDGQAFFAGGSTNSGTNVSQCEVSIEKI